MVIKVLSACAIVILTAAVVHATGSGTQVEELTGPATMVFEGLRFEDFVAAFGLFILGIAGFMLMFSHIGAGLVPILGILVGLGFWFQPQAIAEAINLTAAVM